MARKGPLSDVALTGLALDLSATDIPASLPDDVIYSPGQAWRLPERGRPEVPEGWAPFEALAGAERQTSRTYRFGALLFFAATGLEPRAAGLPFRYEPPREVLALPAWTQKLLAECLRPAWRERARDPASALARASAPPPPKEAPAAPPADPPGWSNFPTGIVTVLPAVALVWALVKALPPKTEPPREPAAAIEKESAHHLNPPPVNASMSDAFPFLKPHTPPALPLSGTRHPLGVAVRTLLSPGRPSGDLLRLTVDGRDILFVRGRQAFPTGLGFARNDGSSALMTGAGWTLRRPDGRRSRLPPIDGVRSADDWRVLLDSRGNVWVGGGPWSGSPTLWRSEGAAWTRLDHAPPFEDATRFSGLAEDEDGSVWVGGRDRLSVLTDGAWRNAFEPDAPRGIHKLGAVFPLRGGAALVAGGRDHWTHSGCLTWLSPDGRERRFGGEDGLQEEVRHVSVDRLGGRLYLLNTDGWLTVGDRSGFSRRYATNDGVPKGLEDVAADGEGRVWLLTDTEAVILPAGSL